MMENIKGEWTCNKCTLINHPTNRICETCLAPRHFNYPNIPENLPVPEVTQLPVKFTDYCGIGADGNKPLPLSTSSRNDVGSGEQGLNLVVMRPKSGAREGSGDLPTTSRSKSAPISGTQVSPAKQASSQFPTISPQSSPKLAPIFHPPQELDSLSDNEMETTTSMLYGPSDMEATDLSMAVSRNSGTETGGAGNITAESRLTPVLTGLNNLSKTPHMNIRNNEKVGTSDIKKVTNPFVPGYSAPDENVSLPSQNSNVDIEDQPLDLTMSIDSPTIYYPPTLCQDDKSTDNNQNMVIDVCNRQTNPFRTEHQRMSSGDPVLQISDPSVSVNFSQEPQDRKQTNLPIGGARKKIQNNANAKETPLRKEKQIQKSNKTRAEQVKLSNSDILSLYEEGNPTQMIQSQNPQAIPVQTPTMANFEFMIGARQNTAEGQFFHNIPKAPQMHLQVTPVLQANQGVDILNPAVLLAGFDPLIPSTYTTAARLPVEQTVVQSNDSIEMNMRDDHFAEEIGSRGLGEEQNNLNSIEGTSNTMNMGMETNSTVCGAENVQQAIQSTDPNVWSCPLCTYNNRRTAQYCETCYDGRPPWFGQEPPSPPATSHEPPALQVPREAIQSQQVSKAFVDEWSCSNCYTSNNPESEHCRRCNQDRPGGFVAIGSTQSIGQPPIPQDRPSTSRQISLENFSFLSTPSLEIPQGSNFGSMTMERLRIEHEEKAQEIYSQIISFCESNEEKFVDDQFPPTNKILWYGNGNRQRNDVVWLRPHQIRYNLERGFEQMRWTVFRNNPMSSDIQQGILGNCWFLSGLSVLVERPELLRKIFLTKEYNPYGVYMIRLCKDGEWKTVIIDDLLPCNVLSELMYTQARRKQLWVPLIEKALAKLHGCYQALQAGRSIEGLATLTGAPCESLHLATYGHDAKEPDYDMIWVQLLSSKEAGFLMGASCGGGSVNVNEQIYHDVELRVRHAYSVLDVRNEHLDNSEVIRLLQLRNPWAQYSWSGDWSDESPLWNANPNLKRRLDPSKSHHGIFWLTFLDMLKYFDSIDICKVRGENWVETRTEGEFSNSALQSPATYFLRVYAPTEVDFSIFQRIQRNQEAAERHPVDVCVCVYRSSERAERAQEGNTIPLGALVACSRRQVKRHGTCSCVLEPGFYQIVTFAFNHWLSSYISGPGGIIGATENPKFVLALHSSRAISLAPCPAQRALLADAVIGLSMREGEKKNVRDYVTCYYLSHGWAGLIVVAENRHPEKHLQVVCDCLDSRNVVSTRGSLRTADCIPPLHKQVLILLTQLDGHSGFTITHKLVHRINGQGLGDWSIKNGNHDPELTADVKALHEPRPL